MLGSRLSGLRGPARLDWGGGGPLARVFSVGIAGFFGGACVGGACGRLAASVVVRFQFFFVFLGGGGGGGLLAVSKVESSASARSSPSEVYPAGKL